MKAYGQQTHREAQYSPETAKLKSVSCPKPGEVGIARQASGHCGGDLRHCRAAKADRDAPARLEVAGHEPGGVIDAIGPGVAEVDIGDRVMMHHYAGCRAGAMCRIGYTQMCRRGSVVYDRRQRRP